MKNRLASIMFLLGLILASCSGDGPAEAAFDISKFDETGVFKIDLRDNQQKLTPFYNDTITLSVSASGIDTTLTYDYYGALLRVMPRAPYNPLKEAYDNEGYLFPNGLISDYDKGIWTFYPAVCDIDNAIISCVHPKQLHIYMGPNKTGEELIYTAYVGIRPYWPDSNIAFCSHPFDELFDAEKVIFPSYIASDKVEEYSWNPVLEMEPLTFVIIRQAAE